MVGRIGARSIGLTFALLLAMLTTTQPANADRAKLTAAEVTALLSGNTAVGDWRGTPYRQYFGVNGTTIYVAKARPPSPGRWKVDQENGDYCSWWEQSGWSCYGIERDGVGYVWVTPGSDYRGRFTLVDGKQLSF